MNKFGVVKKKRLEKSQFNVECNIDVGAEIDKILSIKHIVELENVEILSGVINYAGNINLSLLFSTPDGEIGTTNATCPFTSRFENPQIAAEDVAKIHVTIIDCQPVDVSNQAVKVLCVCEQSCTLITKNEVENVVSNNENVCTKMEDITIKTFVGHATETFNIESQVAIKESVKKLLYADSDVAVKTIENGVDFVAVGGEVVTKILYLSANDRFETCYSTEPFKQEIALDGVNANAISEVEAYVKKSAVKYEIDESDKGVKVNLNVPICMHVFAYEEKTENVVKDIYSTKGDLKISTESFDMTRQWQTEFFETKIDGSLTLDENQPRVDKVMFVGASNLQVTNAYVKEGEVFVEGIVKTNVVYLNDETNALHSVLMEVPFVVSDKTTIDCDNVRVEVLATLYDVDVVVKKGREFYFDAKLKICSSFDCEVVDAVISRVEQDGEYPEKDCAIELYFANENDTAWDIAKAMKTTEEVIYTQNPELTFPLKQDENIVIYYQKQA